MLTEKIKALAAQIADEVIAFRRDLHMHPELSNEEHYTASRIAEELDKIEGMEVFRGLAGGTGVMGMLHGTKGEGKVVLLRADIDALPIQEETGLPFASQNDGVMHACGHDAHAAWLLGSAKILSALRDEICGTVKFVFQPGEEGGGGGPRMVQGSKVLENPAVDAVFAAHAWPEIDSGEMHVAHCAFGHAGGFSITVTGKGGHGSWPHECIDPIAVSHQIYGGLQQIVSRRLHETAARVLSVCTIQSGPQFKGNIIPDQCTMTGTLRSDRREVIAEMARLVEQISKQIAEANDATAEVTTRYGDAVINTPEAIPFALNAGAKILGADKVKEDLMPHLGGEDFTEYITRVPGAYVFAGIATPETKGKFGLHSNKFVLDESVIPNMAAVFAQMAVDFIEKGSF